MVRLRSPFVKRSGRHLEGNGTEEATSNGRTNLPGDASGETTSRPAKVIPAPRTTSEDSLSRKTSLSQPAAEISSGLLATYTVYQQIAGVLGAFTIIAIVGNFVHISWCGMISSALVAWNAYVRPAMSFLLDNTVVALARLIFQRQIVIPEIVRDYLTMGLINYLSDLRVVNWYFAGHAGPERGGSLFSLSLLRHLRFFILDIFAWPLTMSRDLLRLTTLRSRDGNPIDFAGWFATFLSLIPVFYFLVLLAINVSHKSC